MSDPHGATAQDEAGPEDGHATGESDAAGDAPSSDGALDRFDEDEVIEAVLEDLPEEKAVVIRQMVARMHRGPLPDPESFAMYEAVCPGAAERILDYAERNQDHRFEFDHRLSGTARMSLFCTTFVLVAAIAAGVVLGINDQPVLGAIFGAGGLGIVLVQMLRGGGRWTGR